ncbi:hypothetical protein CBA19CS91_11135 [Paraburkholderia hospita]|nr:hypothetical protein CBA19CS91_11135 [Paraburkholderia hospita]
MALTLASCNAHCRVDARASLDEQRDRRLFADFGQARAWRLFKRPFNRHIAADVLVPVVIGVQTDLDGDRGGRPCLALHVHAQRGGCARGKPGQHEREWRGATILAPFVGTFVARQRVKASLDGDEVVGRVGRKASRSNVRNTPTAAIDVRTT